MKYLYKVIVYVMLALLNAVGWLWCKWTGEKFERFGSH